MILKNVSLVLFVADNCFNIFLLVGLSVFIMYSSVTVSLIHFPPFMSIVVTMCQLFLPIYKYTHK